MMRTLLLGKYEMLRYKCAHFYQNTNTSFLAKCKALTQIKFIKKSNSNVSLVFGVVWKLK